MASLRGGTLWPSGGQPQSRSVGLSPCAALSLSLPWSPVAEPSAISWLPSPPISQALSFSHRSQGSPPARGGSPTPAGILFQLRARARADVAGSGRRHGTRVTVAAIQIPILPCQMFGDQRRPPPPGSPPPPLSGRCRMGKQYRQHRRDSERCVEAVEAVWTTHCWRRAPGNSA